MGREGGLPCPKLMQLSERTNLSVIVISKRITREYEFFKFCPVIWRMLFPIVPMHLVYLGAVRKLLHKWCNQRRCMKVKNAKQIITEISRILDDIEKLIPVEFNRKTRSLDDISRLKATECRLLLLCVLPVILKHRLPEQVYQHVKLTHCHHNFIMQ